MPSRLENRHWRSLLWWLAVLALSVQLKHHYSIATAADLEWMLRPLSLLLEWFSGHEYSKDANHEWVSESADVRLVKACAGVNFMLMSFAVYAWLVRPDRRANPDPWSWAAGQLLLLCAALIASWMTSLLANSLRIMLALSVASHGWELDAVGIDAAQLHRLIGMGIYVPLLSLQMTLGHRTTMREVFAAPVLLYLLLMLVVPLLTGNAMQNPALFIRHLLNVSVMMAVMGGVYLLCRHRWPGKRRQTAPTPGE